ncbi:MAG: alanine racemase [Steroidobacter sp.]
MNFPQATIDCAALRNNLAVVRRFAPRSRVMAAVKANAYGHGLIPAARALASADAFGLARINEALILRTAGITHPLVLLEGVATAEDLAAAAANRLEIVVHSFEQIAMLEEFDGVHRFAVWLKLDSGMHRLGLAPRDFVPANARLNRCRAVESVRLMTHLAAAEALDSSYTRQQLDLFNAATEGLDAERSIANSAGLIAWPETRVDWVRPGLMLYGMSPMRETSAEQLGLRAAMTLSTRLIALGEVKEGEVVGYGGVWRAARDSRIGIAAIGYGDGYPRGMHAGAPILVNGQEVTLAGRVSMDMTAIDLTDLPHAKVGDEVTLWGEHLPAERVARYADTLGYELVCRVTERVRVEWK